MKYIRYHFKDKYLEHSGFRSDITFLSHFVSNTHVSVISPLLLFLIYTVFFFKLFTIILQPVHTDDWFVNKYISFWYTFLSNLTFLLSCSWRSAFTSNRRSCDGIWYWTSGWKGQGTDHIRYHRCHCTRLDSWTAATNKVLCSIVPNAN